MVLRGCRAVRVVRFHHAFMISSGRLAMLPSCRLPFCGPVVFACAVSYRAARVTKSPVGSPLSRHARFRSCPGNYDGRVPYGHQVRVGAPLRKVCC